ncbi:hypothetical protein C0Q44_28005 [Paenibacillus sp. PCH8]|nr:hypothetical protein C0Q44_28005 [Paenibacillus sp. PCH8]
MILKNNIFFISFFLVFNFVLGFSIITHPNLINSLIYSIFVTGLALGIILLRERRIKRNQ